MNKDFEDFLNENTGLDNFVDENVDLVTNTNDYKGINNFISKMRVDHNHVKEVGTYNACVGKSDYKNSLTSGQIKYYDKLLSSKISKESQKAHNLYSRNSNIVNDYLHFNKNEARFLEKYNKKDLVLAKIHLKGLNSSKVVTTDDITVYKGFEKGPFNSNIINNKNSFISTSLDEAISIGYTRGTGDHISIKVPKGTEVIYIRKYSKYPNHMEILIPPKYYIPEYKVNGKFMYETRKR